MEIRQFRLVVRAREFERSCRFYGEILAFPRLQSWDREDSRGALYQAGGGVIEVLGRGHGASRERDEGFDYEGPDQKLAVTLVVASVEKAYEEASFRERNIPGGPFFAGAKPNVVDLKLHMAVRWFIGGVVDYIPATIFADYPKLMGVYEAVKEHTGVKAWYAKK